VSAHQACYPIATMCRVLGVSTSGYYAWRNRSPSRREQENAALLEQILILHVWSRRTFGAPRIHVKLVEEGVKVGHNRVARLMRRAGIQGVTRRKRRGATQRNPEAQPADDLVDRTFTRTAPNQLWVADITYIPTGEGVLYLAVVVDAYSRRVIGWAMATRMKTQLVLDALEMAIRQRRPKGVIHHSDHGSQYTSIEFGRRCRKAGIRPSMGTVGDCFDNALCESFFATLECELLDRNEFSTRAEARRAVFDFIEGWYNFTNCIRPSATTRRHPMRNGTPNRSPRRGRRRRYEQAAGVTHRTSTMNSRSLVCQPCQALHCPRNRGNPNPAFIQRLAEESGMENPTEEDARRLNRRRKRKKASNKEWASATDSDARIAKLKDGRTRLAYKSEHVVDLETGAMVGVVVHPADWSDAATIGETLEVAEENLRQVNEGESSEHQNDEGDNRGSPGGLSLSGSVSSTRSVVADKGYHKATVLQQLKEKRYRTYIPERRHKGKRRWTDKGGRQTAVAFYQNRARVKRKKGKALQRKREELLERTFAHLCETGGARRTRLRGRANVSKRYLLQASAANPGLVMRNLYGWGTPRGLAELPRTCARGVARLRVARESVVDAIWRLVRHSHPRSVPTCAA